jgi:hypothetical protein
VCARIFLRFNRLWPVAPSTRSKVALISRSVPAREIRVICSDRWSAYSKLPLKLRQICWGHLKRDIQKLVDRGGPAEAIGQVALEVVECLFANWWTFRRCEMDRAGCKPARTRLCANSNAFWSRVARVRIPRQRPSAPTYWRSIWRCACSRQSSALSPRTTMRHVFCGWACCAQERIRLSQGGSMPVCGANADRGSSAAIAETSGAGIPSSRDRRASDRPCISAITGPS